MKFGRLNTLLLALLFSVAPAWSQYVPGAYTKTAVVTGGTWTTNAYTCATQGNNSLSATCTFSTSPTAGMTVVCSAITFISGQTFSIKDSNNDAFTMIGTQYADASTGRYLQIGWFPKLTTTITTVTLTETASGFPTINCDAATDSGASPAVDGTGCSADSTAGTSTASCGPFSLASTDYVLAVSITGSGSTVLTAQSPLTNGSTNNSANVLNGYGTTSGSVTPSFGLNTVDTWDILAVAFKP